MFTQMEFLLLIHWCVSLCGGVLETDLLKSFMYRMEEGNKQIENVTKVITDLQRELMESRMLNVELQMNMKVKYPAPNIENSQKGSRTNSAKGGQFV